MAGPKDIILIAGKGHENYQEIKGERFDFDDYKIVQEYLKQLQKQSLKLEAGSMKLEVRSENYRVKSKKKVMTNL